MTQFEPTDEQLAARGLPEIAFIDNANKRFHKDAQVIAVKRGEMGFYPIYTHCTADFLNEGKGVNPQQREAMLAGSMFGWSSSAADPLSVVARGLSGDAGAPCR